MRGTTIRPLVAIAEDFFGVTASCQLVRHRSQQQTQLSRYTTQINPFVFNPFIADRRLAWGKSADVGWRRAAFAISWHLRTT